MKTLTLIECSMACLVIMLLPAFAETTAPVKPRTTAVGWIGAFLGEARGGVRVNDAIRDGPADKAGVRAGDLIVEADGRSVRSPAELSGAVRDSAVGRDMTLRLRRDGGEQTLTVKVAERPEWFGGGAGPGEGWTPRGSHGEWRWDWPPGPWSESGSVEKMQKQIDKLRQQVDELKEKVEKHLSGKEKEPSRI